VGPTLSGEIPTIETLEFVTSGELRARIETAIGLPDDALVCYAVIRGPFLATRISLPPGRGRIGPTPMAGAIGETYDARTGRLLVSRGVPHKHRAGD
jgi:hypothetical protein